MSEARAGLPVRVRGLCRHFQMGEARVEVLQDLDMDLAPGDRVAVVGRSGSGKTTLLQILGILDRPDAGTVELGDQDIFRLSGSDVDTLRNRKIGFIFQFHHLLPDLTAQLNVALPLIIGGMRTPEALERAGVWLGRVGLGHRMEHRPGELSGGEQQRVAIARALVMDPGLLLADEPTGNLDPRTADVVMGLLLDLNALQGSTLMVVTHSRELAARFPRRLEVVDGRLQELP